MNRRDVLKSIGAITATSLVGISTLPVEANTEDYGPVVSYGVFMEDVRPGNVLTRLDAVIDTSLKDYGDNIDHLIITSDIWQAALKSMVKIPYEELVKAGRTPPTFVETTYQGFPVTISYLDTNWVTVVYK